jgi:hypothetical protein
MAEQPISRIVATLILYRFLPQKPTDRLLNRIIRERLLFGIGLLRLQPHQFDVSELLNEFGVEAHLGLRLAAWGLRLYGGLSQRMRLFELVGGKGVTVRRPPDFESGLPLIVRLNIFGVDSWHRTFSIQLLPPLDHVAHALVQIGSVVLAGSHGLHFRRDVIKALLQQSFEVILLHLHHVPCLGTRLEVTFDNRP